VYISYRVYLLHNNSSLTIIPILYCCAPDCSWKESADAADQYYRSVVKGNSMDDLLFRSWKEKEKGAVATKVWREASRLANGIRTRDWDFEERYSCKTVYVFN